MVTSSIFSHVTPNDEIEICTIEDYPEEATIKIDSTLNIFLPIEKLEELFNLIDKFLHDEKETSAAWQERALKAELECENKDDRIAYLEEQIDMFRHEG